MNRKNVFVVTLVIFLRFEKTLSALHWMYTDSAEDTERDDYLAAREASNHRGFLLSLSAAQKHEICLDCFYAQLYKEINPTGAKGKRKTMASEAEGQTKFQSEVTGIEQTLTTEGIPEHALSIARVEAIDGKPETGIEDLMFTCLGKNFPYRAPDHNSEIYLSYAFRSSWMYGLFPSIRNGMPHGSIVWFTGLSPEYVEMTQTKLENEYISIRKTMRALEKESPSYSELVELRDNMSDLTEKQMRYLCGSILATSTYRDIGLEFSSLWITSNEFIAQFQKITLTFYNADYNTKDGWKADCILCKAFYDGDDYDGDYVNLYMTQTYDNKDSVLVLKEIDGKIYLSKYFKNVHIFKNVEEGFEYRNLYEYR